MIKLLLNRSSRSISERMAAFGGQKAAEPAPRSNAPQPRERAGPTSCDAPSIIKGYNQVRDDNDPVNLAIFEQDDATGKIRLVKTSEEGITALQQVRLLLVFASKLQTLTITDWSCRKSQLTEDSMLMLELLLEMIYRRDQSSF